MKRDQLAGSATLILGALYAAYAFLSLPLGTLRRMGPGMFPFGLGILLALIGLGILLAALRHDVPRPALPVRNLILPLAAVVTFAVLIRPLGLLPALVATVVIGAIATSRPSPVVIAALAAGLALVTWAIFILLLGLPIPLINWPF